METKPTHDKLHACSSVESSQKIVRNDVRLKEKQAGQENYCGSEECQKKHDSQECGDTP